jgi:hypothetical protein
MQASNVGIMFIARTLAGLCGYNVGLYDCL